MKVKGLVFLAALALAVAPLKGAWAAPTAPQASSTHHPKHSLSEEEKAYIGIEESLGAQVPLEASFLDEKGERQSLKELMGGKPTILSLVYYTCPDVCPLLLGGVAEVVERMPSTPGKDYRLLTLSFDEKDTPADAAKKKVNFLRAEGEAIPEEAWTFLVGDQENIRSLTDAVGFKFKREGKIFLHPVSLVVLSPGGKVVRYLYGTTFLPFDLKMALTEASEGRTGPTISRVLLYCFSYDPKGRTYTLNILRVAGAATVIVLGAFFLTLIFKGKIRSRKEG